MSSFKQNIRDFIAKSQLDAALEAVKKRANDGATELDTPVTLLLGELEYLKKRSINGLLTAEDERVERQNLSFRLLNLIENWTETAANTEGSNATNATPSPPPKDVILFLGANPFANLVLELAREIEQVSHGLEQFGKRDSFDFRAKMHVSPIDLQRMLLDSDTSARFVHFAGNAVVDHKIYGSGVIFEGDDGKPQVIGGKVLAAVFGQFSNVECVFLNTCDSGPFALDIGQKVRYAIGMNSRIWDDTAIRFAVAFYEAIGNGRDVPFAFDFAKTRLLLEMPYAPEQADIPILIANGKCDAPVYVGEKSHLDETNGVRPMR